PLLQRNKSFIFWADVVRARTNYFSVIALFDNVRAPACHTGNDKKWGKKRGRYAHQVVRYGRKPVQVRKHSFFIPKQSFHALSNVKKTHIASLFRKSLRDRLDHLISRISNGIDGMPKSDDHFLAG